jgi:4-hydroxy 2-oxovalerate aldolase
LETGVEDKDRQELTRENTEMIADIVQTNPEFEIHFITQSEYSKALE